MILTTPVSAGRAICHKQSMRFLDCNENWFLMQVINEPMKRYWNCNSKIKEELIEDLKIEGSLCSSNCEAVEFKILRELSKINSRITALDFRRADLGLFREAWETVLQGKRPWGSWLIFKDSLLRTQEQFTMFRKLSKHGRRPVWMNMELLPELKHKWYTEGGSRDRVLGRNQQRLFKHEGIQSGKPKWKSS